MGQEHRLRELREAAGLSQVQLAKLTGVSRNAVSQWEAGETRPSTKRLTLLARALNVPIDQLMAPSTQVRERILEVATRLLESLGADQASSDAICAAAQVPRAEFDILFNSKDALIFEVTRAHNERKLEHVRRTPPRFGSLAARLKNLLRHLYVLDLEHPRIVAALHASSWHWSEARERDYNRQLLEFHEMIVAVFDEAAAQGQIDTGNYRAASSLILASYQLGFRKAVYEKCDPDRLISFLEPQIAIILQGFNFRIVTGFADGDSKPL